MRENNLDFEDATDVSHNFLTPLQGVLGNVRLLLETDLSAAQKDHAEMIQSSAQQLLLEVRSLLNQPTNRNRAELYPDYPEGFFKGVRILLVEDNLINQKVAAKTLEKYGIAVTLADHGLEALKRLSAENFDLILMDCQMPELDGYETTRRIRAYPVHVRNIPIIAMTANTLSKDRERCLQSGMDDYLTKPFFVPELLATLDQHLRRAALRR